MTTQEGNKLIKLFTEKDNVSEVVYEMLETQKAKMFQDCDYHENWNSLISACKKFDLIDTIKMSPHQRKEYEINCCLEIGNAVARYDISAAWKELVKAIQWYNQNTPKQ